MSRKGRVDLWREAVRCSDLPPTARHVALALSEYMDFNTLGSAYPGAFRLAGQTGLCVRTVQRMLSLLAERGWIVQTFRGGSPCGGPRRASAYRGAIPKGQVGPTTQCHRSTAGPMTRTTPTYDTDDADLRHSDVAPWSIPGSGPAGGGSATATPASPLRPVGAALKDIFGRKPSRAEVLALCHFVDEHGPELEPIEWERFFVGMRQADMECPQDVRHAAESWLKVVVSERGAERMLDDIEQLLDAGTPGPIEPSPVGA